MTPTVNVRSLPILQLDRANDKLVLLMVLMGVLVLTLLINPLIDAIVLKDWSPAITRTCIFLLVALQILGPYLTLTQIARKDFMEGLRRALETDAYGYSSITVTSPTTFSAKRGDADIRGTIMSLNVGSTNGHRSYDHYAVIEMEVKF